MQNQITRYTPSLMSQEELESIFVQRQPLLDTLFERHKHSVLTASKNFSLLIAPRGMGKTHLVSMLINQLKADPDVANSMMLAWLREEEWGISSYQDLLCQIIKCLQHDYRLAPIALFDQLYTMDECDAQLALEGLLLALLGDKTLLLIAENLNIIFDAIQKEGQEKLRALIQNSGRISIVAAAQALFSGVATRKGPFYGFFTPYHLQKLNFEDALQLLKNIATRNSNESLLEMLDTDKGRARVRALHHLASGSPRIYVMFSQFIQADNLNEFTGPVLQMLDELTPYYQAKMLELPAQQRKLVITLCRQQGAITVQDLAKQCHITQQTASSQLKKLKDNGFVGSSQYGRQSYYEIAEPLMRMVLSIKEQRGGAVKLAIDIIRHFFTISEMKTIVNQPETNILGLKLLTKDMLEQALNVKEPSPHIIATIKSFEEAIRHDAVIEAQQVLTDYFNNHEPSEDFEIAWRVSVEKLLAGKGFSQTLSTIINSVAEIDVYPLVSSTVCYAAIMAVNGNRYKKHCQKNKCLREHISNLSESGKGYLFLTTLNVSSAKHHLVDVIIDFQLLTVEAFKVFVRLLKQLKQKEELKNQLLKLFISLLTKVTNLNPGELAAMIFVLVYRALINDEQFMYLLKSKTLSEADFGSLVMFVVDRQDIEHLELINHVLSEMNYHGSIKLLANVALEYLKTEDPKHLLKLPKEYRALIKWAE